MNKDIDHRPGTERLREPADEVFEAEGPTGTRRLLPRRDGWIDETLFPIVGVGASAGGLEAFSQLLQHMPSDTGMAFVLIQHLERTHVSVLAEHLAKLTTMLVQRVETGATVQPNHVYVIPNEADVTIVDGKLLLVPRDPSGPSLHLPVNLFLNALAAERGSYAVGVVLSGRAHDGTEGLRAIKAADGLTFAQDPSTARYPDMPQSALDARVVDHCLAIPALVQELARLTKQPYLMASPNQPRSLDAAFMRDIFDCIKLRRGIDFKEYKAATLKRRLLRRMVMRGLEHSAYLTLLQNDAAELDALCDDLLIHVTSFFRNPEVFEALKGRVFAQLFARKPPGAPLRIWIAGCSTGEEVYSIAITLLEFLDGASLPVQICGSDLSERAIAYARAGHYPKRAMRDVSIERRQRFFKKTKDGYQIKASVRKLCIFARHDLMGDPPFSKIDLVSCRNVLIYFELTLQKRVLATLHYALAASGFLLIGRPESIGMFSELFSVIDKASKVFAPNPLPNRLRLADSFQHHGQNAGHMIRKTIDPSRNELAKHFDRLLLSRYCPPAVLIDDSLDILLFRGAIGTYLEPVPGDPQSNLMKMARAGLLGGLREVLEQVRAEMAPVVQTGVEIEQNGSLIRCNIVAMPFLGLPHIERLWVILFEPATSSEFQPLPGPIAPAALDQNKRVARLEHELKATQGYLRSLTEEQGRTNSELGSANEQLTTGNEELQSLNEELETAKEELQSLNEELITVNDELSLRNTELNHANADLLNLLTTVDIPIVILDGDRCVRRFTPKAQSLLHLANSDVGRPFEDIQSKSGLPVLDGPIRDVIAAGSAKEIEVQDRDGHWHRLHIRPYKTASNSVKGAVLSFLDIDALKHHVRDAKTAEFEADRANRAKDDFLATLSHELRTPLSSVLMQAELMRGGHLSTAQMERAVAIIERGTKLQVQLIDDLLDVSRIVAGKLKVELEPVEPCLAIQAAIDGVSETAQRKAIVLRTALDETIGDVWGDPTRIQQVVSNLLTNAIKFTPAAGEISVGLAAVDGYAQLTVRDSGMGIDPLFLPHIFDRFSQKDGSTTRKYGGLGLGLAIVRYLVEAQGGRVTAESEGLGKGATFTVTFALTTLAVRSREAHAPAELKLASPLDRPGSLRTYAALHGLRVLVVDDDPSTLDAIADVLRLSGAVARAAASSAAALQVLETFSPDVIICDIAMPGEDGHAFIRKLRARGADMPALALTALSSAEDRRSALASGFQMHMTKPIDIDRLRDGILGLIQLNSGSVGQA